MPAQPATGNAGCKAEISTEGTQGEKKGQKHLLLPQVWAWLWGNRARPKRAYSLRVRVGGRLVAGVARRPGRVAVAAGVRWASRPCRGGRGGEAGDGSGFAGPPGVSLCTRSGTVQHLAAVPRGRVSLLCLTAVYQCSVSLQSLGAGLSNVPPCGSRCCAGSGLCTFCASCRGCALRADMLPAAFLRVSGFCAGNAGPESSACRGGC